MKTIATTIVVSALCFVMLNGNAAAQFKKDKAFLGVNLTLATDPIGFGVDFEYGVSPNIGIGGLIRYWGQSYNSYGYSWSYSFIIPQLQGSYHFMPGDQLDPYVGARLGYAIVSVSGTTWGSETVAGSLGLNAVGGIRYFFSPKISGNGSLEFRLVGDNYFNSGIGLMVGVDFTL